MSTATLTRPARTYTAETKRSSVYEDGENGSRMRFGKRRRAARQDAPPLMQKVGLAAQVYGMQSVRETIHWFQGWREYFYPPVAGHGPNIVKAYENRPGMSVRIFFPASYDLTSPQTLPTVLTIHGGGFCTGANRDDDAWNRAFADAQQMLVVSLPYSKAPRAPYPGALYDLEALYLAVLEDESLPIARGAGDRRSSISSKGRGKVAILGFDAGGNLALALSQLPKIRHCATPPTAVVSVSGFLDLERTVAEKAVNRPYKAALPAPRSAAVDPLAAVYEAFVWSYVPYGHDLRDPLLSPAFAGCDDGRGGGLPAHVCLVGAELDVLAHESWRMACRLVRDVGVARGDGRLGKWRVPDPDEGDLVQRICGRSSCGGDKDALEMSDLPEDDMESGRQDGLSASKRFGFEERWQDGEGSVKWVLVPDELHGFDREVAAQAAGEASTMKPAYVDAVGTWLRSTVWAA